MGPTGREPSTTAATDSPARRDGGTPAPVATVTVRYWAAARSAVGSDSEPRTGATVGEVVDAAVGEHPALGRVASVATFLLDGRKVGRDAPLTEGVTVEVLPPFAGG